MSKIIEVQPGKYHYINWNGLESELEFAYLRGQADDNYKCIRVNGKLGIIKDYKSVIADPVYSSIRCNWNRQNNIINYFEYSIDISDESGKDYKVYGKILVDGTVIQDAKLHYDHDYNKRYSLRIPSKFIFICHLFNKYYLYNDKCGNYGMLEFDENLQPISVGSHENNPWNEYNYKSFLYEDIHQKQICFFRENKHENFASDDRARRWFVYSNVTKEGHFVKNYDRIESIRQIKNAFWWFKNDEYYGLIDPYLKVILPPAYYVSKEDLSDIDFVIASKKNSKWGVLKIHENEKSPEWGEKSINENNFFKTFVYKEYLPFVYNRIYRSGDYLTIENDNGKQFIYSIKKNCNITPPVFSNIWTLAPETIGDGIVGGFQNGYGGNVIWPKGKYNYKYAFLDIYTGETIIELPNNMFITEGFKKGNAIVMDTDGFKYRIDKTGNLFRIKTKQGSLSELEKEENYEDPFINHYSEEEEDNFYGMTDGMEGDLW